MSGRVRIGSGVRESLSIRLGTTNPAEREAYLKERVESAETQAGRAARRALDALALDLEVQAQALEEMSIGGLDDQPSLLGARASGLRLAASVARRRGREAGLGPGAGLILK